MRESQGNRGRRGKEAGRKERAKKWGRSRETRGGESQGKKVAAETVLMGNCAVVHVSDLPPPTIHLLLLNTAPSVTSPVALSLFNAHVAYGAHCTSNAVVSLMYLSLELQKTGSSQLSEQRPCAHTFNARE